MQQPSFCRNRRAKQTSGLFPRRKTLRQISILVENSIFRVPGTLRRRKESVYEPKIVSIGPFHRGKERLEPMERIKMWYLHCLLARLPDPPEENLQHFIGTVRELVKRAPNCYAEKIDLTEDKNVEMMIVDGCFLLELLRRDAWLGFRYKDDPIFNTYWMLENFYHDLVLLENQIPWLVLECLFSQTASDDELEADFLIKLVLLFFRSMMLMTEPAEFKSSCREIKHVLDLLHRSILSSSEDIVPTYGNLELFPPVTDLLRAGVKFEKGTPDNILNIKFDKNKGVFQVPPIEIQGNSESLFWNLIAYEQCDRHSKGKFTSYAVFLGCLVNTSWDADWLCSKKILDHVMSTEDMLILFNRLRNDTLVYNFHYAWLAKEVETRILQVSMPAVESYSQAQLF